MRVLAGMFTVLIKTFIASVLFSTVVSGAAYSEPVNGEPETWVTVSTDKSSYIHGETIEIYITFHNGTEKTKWLDFQSTLQAKYQIVDHYEPFFSKGWGFTHQKIEPNSSYTWTINHLSTRYLLPVGNHSIIGEVIGYGTSEPINVEIVRTPIEGEFQEEYKPYLVIYASPNPANPVATISYSIPYNSEVLIDVYSITGQRITTLVDDFKQAGSHSVVFDGSSLSSGVYFYRVSAGRLAGTGKITLVK